ncbi:MAG: ATP-dependent DNA ligase, partial [Hadesarchaea archaeon]|nr:ATP-dependent DNA ligase [Hadesarchaea archaeon]
MQYKSLAESLEKLEETTSYLEKNSIISELLNETPKESIEKVVRLLLGRVYPAFVSQETGIGLQQLKKAVGKVTGYSEDKIDDFMEEIGDLGDVAEKLTKNKKQVTLAESTLTVEEVHDNIHKIPTIIGEGSVDRKIRTVAKLLSNASPVEAKFIVRTILGDLRIGVAEGRLRDAISEAFNVSSEAVEHAYMLTTDYGKVAKAVAENGEEGLSELGLTVGHPVNPMLAQRTEGIRDVLDRMGGEAAFEMKLDGIRIQPHKGDGEVFLFTRRMEDYTSMFPELEEPIKQSLKLDQAIVDGELVAIDPETGEPMPFQEVLRRRRKYDIEEVAEEIPVEIHLFDILLAGEETIIEEPYLERRKRLEEVIKPSDKVKLVEQKILDDCEEIEEFQKSATSQGHEGLLAKDLDSVYRAGKREFAWLKLKSEAETLDLIVVGADAGKGKRAGTFGSYLLAARDPETNEFRTVTKIGSGYTDEDLEELTKKFKSITRKEKPPEVRAELEPDHWISP